MRKRSMSNFFCGLLLIFGSAISFIAGLGMLRMPDIMMRMHAGTKAGTLGLSLILIATAIHFGTMAVGTKVVLTILFIFITIPIGAQMLGRAAYIINVPLWEKTVVDELREYYDKK